jgi:signal transduction histidine kinase
MPLDLSNPRRTASSDQREQHRVSWTSVHNFIPPFGARPQRIAIAKFAHEFANELNVVSGLVHFLEKEIDQPSRAKKTLRHLQSEILHLGSLLNELQSLAQAQKVSLQPGQLEPVIRELLTIDAPRYAARGIRVEIDLPSDLPQIRLDAVRFRQALLNLCRNAVDAMPHGGQLTVRAYRAGSNVQLDVSDTGEGIPPGLDVFALFTSTKPAGMGLGLSIVREIISRHQGNIAYTSEPGAGTTFRLTLPVCE